jgi:hypothetical protein
LWLSGRYGGHVVTTANEIRLETKKAPLRALSCELPAAAINLGLEEEAHRSLKISPEEFDEVAAELGRSLDFAKVPAREKGEFLAAFETHKKEVTADYKKK